VEIEMRPLALVLGLALLSACSQPAAPAKPPPAPAAAKPAEISGVITFEGVLPCADCPGLKTELVLTPKGEGWAEGTYRLTETYLERGGPMVTTGDWTTLRGDASDPDATVYQLDPDKPEGRRAFLRVGQDEALRILDGDMKTLPPGLPDRLERKR